MLPAGGHVVQAVEALQRLVVEEIREGQGLAELDSKVLGGAEERGPFR